MLIAWNKIVSQMKNTIGNTICFPSENSIIMEFVSLYMFLEMQCVIYATPTLLNLIIKYLFNTYTCQASKI